MANNTPYLLPIEETLRTAWDKVKGSKTSFWTALIISILISFGIGLVGGIASNISEFLAGVINLIGQVVSTLISIGITYMGIQRAKNAPINYKQMFYAFERPVFFKVIGLYLIQILIFLPLVFIVIFLPMLIFGTAIGDTLASGYSLANFLLASWIVLGVLVGFYLFLRIVLSTGFVLDRGSDPWPAIKQSFAASRSNELRILAILVFELIAFILGAIPLGLGLIWVLPFIFIVYGVTYKSLLVNVTR